MPAYLVRGAALRQADSPAVLKGQDARHLFNVRNHVDAEDFGGRELPDLAAATDEAQKDILDMRARFETISNWSYWSIEICDDKCLVKVMPFSARSGLVEVAGRQADQNKTFASRHDQPESIRASDGTDDRCGG